MIDLEDRGLKSILGISVLSVHSESDEDCEKIFIAFANGQVLYISALKPPTKEWAKEYWERFTQSGAVDVPCGGWTKDYERSFVSSDIVIDQTSRLLRAISYKKSVITLLEMQEEKIRARYFEEFGEEFRLWYGGLHLVSATE